MQRALWILLGSSLAMSAGLGASACSAAIEPDTTPTAEPEDTSSATPTATSSAPPPDAGQVERVKGAAAAYSRFEKVVPELHVAPTLCAAKLPQAPRTLFRSESTDAWSHGKKLYYLFASDAASYRRDGGREGTKQPDSQVIVKESYVAEESAYDPGEPEMIGEGAKFWKKGARASLFVMLRHEGKWEFGTVSPTGEIAVEGTATAGCHDCHDGKPDGLFGLKKEH